MFAFKLIGNFLLSVGSAACVLSLSNQIDDSYQLLGLFATISGGILTVLLSESKILQTFLSLLLIVFSGMIANYSAGNTSEFSGILSIISIVAMAVPIILFSKYNKKRFYDRSFERID